MDDNGTCPGGGAAPGKYAVPSEFGALVVPDIFREPPPPPPRGYMSGGSGSGIKSSLMPILDPYPLDY